MEAALQLCFCRTSRGFSKTFRWSCGLQGLNVKRTDHIFWMVSSYSRIVWYRGSHECTGGGGSSAMYMNILWILKINCTGEHRSSCYLLEAIRIKFCGTCIPQISRYPASSSVGYHVLLDAVVALNNWWHGIRLILEGERQIYGFHQLLPGELPDRREGTGDTLAQVLFVIYQGQTAVSRSSWPMIL